MYVRFTVLGLALLISACSPDRKVVTNKAAGFDREIKRLYIVDFSGGEYGEEFNNAFHSGLVDVAKNCGATAELVAPGPLDLIDRGQEALKSGADSLLAIRRGNVLGPGAGYVPIYDVQLIDLASKRTVWRANANARSGTIFVPATERGRTLAIDLTNNMKSDGILRGCPLVTSAH
jgi:hypothetical protein